MAFIYLSICIIILLVAILLMIFAPKINNFYSLPFIQNKLLESQAILNIQNIKPDDWKLYPDQDLWKIKKPEPVQNPNGKFLMWDLFFANKINMDFAKRCPNIFDLIKKIPNIKTAFIGKVQSLTTLEQHATWKSLANSTLRCILPIQSTSEIQECGVWVDCLTKAFVKGTWITFDHSKKWTIYNKTDEDLIFLVLDIKRPMGVAFGTSDTPNLKK
jgi:hypothetical protein